MLPNLSSTNMIYKILIIGLAILAIQVRDVISQDGFASLNGGTTGGRGGPTVFVSTQAELANALKDDSPRIVKITQLIELNGNVSVGSHKTILGSTSTSGVTGSGFFIKGKKNVIIRGLTISKPIAPADGVSIDKSTNIWVDHNEFFGDLSKDKDFYDGLIDAIHGSDFITVSWNKFHDHYKTSLFGHSDNNGREDTGKLRSTFHHNYYLNCNSRLPSIRFGTAHMYNNVYENIPSSGINSRMGAQVLVERNVFIRTERPVVTNLFSVKDGFAVARENEWGKPYNKYGKNITQWGNFTNPPYKYKMHNLYAVHAIVTRNAGVWNCN